VALRTRLELRQTQRLGLSAGVMGALSVLRMSAAELAEALQREAETNPFLLPGLPPPVPPGIAGAEGWIDELPAAEPDWQVSLLRQLALKPLDPPVARLAAWLVGELDESGWLDTPLAELALHHRLPMDTLQAALAAIQSCEPAGVGARDMTECLALQLVDLGLDPAAARATLAELPRFARRDWAGIGRALGLSPDTARGRAALLRRLTPRPVTAAAGPSQVLRPDLVLTRSQLGETGVELARDHLPRPTVDSALARRARAEGFGDALLDRAQAMVRAVDSRGATLLRIGAWLVRRQDRALQQGPGALRPALRAECAAELGLHPSTVGRAAAGKALLADGRLWPLARLFTTPAPGRDGNAPDTPGAAAVAHRIATLIAAEDPARPLTDTALQTILATEGVDMARRTVAKYRHGLRIPSAPRRRERN